MNNELKNVNAENQLIHYGIKGQKWGIRRFQTKDGTLTPAGKKRYNEEYKKDSKEESRQRTRLAAAAKNLKNTSKIYKNTEKAYKEVERDYRKISSNKFLMSKERNELLRIKGNELTRTNELLKKTTEDLNRAERIYDKNYKKYDSLIKELKKKYSKNNVDDIETKDIKLGNGYVKSIAKTGITVSNIPFIGNIYTDWYIDKENFNDIRKKVN